LIHRHQIPVFKDSRVIAVHRSAQIKGNLRNSITDDAINSSSPSDQRSRFIEIFLSRILPPRNSRKANRTLTLHPDCPFHSRGRIHHATSCLDLFSSSTGTDKNDAAGAKDQTQILVVKRRTNFENFFTKMRKAWIHNPLLEM
jgi:hypothetical protein